MRVPIHHRRCHVSLFDFLFLSFFKISLFCPRSDDLTSMFFKEKFYFLTRFLRPVWKKPAPPTGCMLALAPFDRFPLLDDEFIVL